ncbi:uncharacterized protein J4E88_006790 [Alternaria novae-zelandiae]|uniref:uncharacterized protein n=1 Tax=Alternaria novae-zelandiae TaxID=430562 RepID=UPI0020C47B25|nr:uncharacterized protein J4E88_006790 [Alternaria novae-zelandiae]KAI4678269.1 hypothetical protein J4E88_006790 [Alternaria novae-zelandiae]
MGLISSAIRLYTRAFIRKPFGTDDWFMLVGTILFIGQQYIAWMWTILGGGLHVTDPRVKPENLKKISTYLFAEEFYYLLLQFFIKMSFLFFYRRTLEVTPGFRIAVITTMILVGLQTSGTWIFYGLQCIPIQAFFTPELYPNAVCISSGLSYYLPSVANVFMDVVIYLLPIYPLWNVQTTVRRRIGLMCVFTLGGCTIMISLLRFIVLWQLANTKDVSYIFGSVTIVTSIEFAVAIITANMPGMYGFYRARVSRKEQSSTEGYHFGIATPGSKGRSLGNASRVTKGSKLSTHGEEDDVRTGSQDELYPMSNLGESEEEQNIRVTTKVIVEGEDPKRLPRSSLRSLRKGH